MILDTNTRWKRLEAHLEEIFHKKMTMESILFLIGVRELGAAPREFSKEEKVDLMHIAICRIFAQSGYYELEYLDEEGWPHWRLMKPLPHQHIFSQVYLLKEHVLTYFEMEGLFEEESSV